jgi:hypothetical protein
VATPLNAILVDMVHQVEQTGRFWTMAAMGAAIGAAAEPARASSRQST